MNVQCSRVGRGPSGREYAIACVGGVWAILYEGQNDWIVRSAHPDALSAVHELDGVVTERHLSVDFRLLGGICS